MIKSQLCVKQNCLPSISYQTLQTSKMNFENPLGEHVLKNNNCVRFSLLQFCPSVLPFVLAALYIPSLECFKRLFYCFTKPEKKADILRRHHWVVFPIGRAAWEIYFNQSKALPKYRKRGVISMEFLQSFNSQT